MIFVGVGPFFQETKTCFPIGLTLLFHEFHLWPRSSWVRSVGCHNGWFDCVGNISQGWGCKCCSLASVISVWNLHGTEVSSLGSLTIPCRGAEFFLGTRGHQPQSPGHVIRCSTFEDQTLLHLNIYKQFGISIVTFMGLFCFGMVD